MGWTGCYTGYSPKGKERIDTAIQQEGFEFEAENRKSHVIDSAIRGNTVYLAVHFTDTDKNRNEVYGVVILTKYRNGWFNTKAIDETSSPCESNCPKRIIKKLTPTNNEWANEWRYRCLNKKTA